MRTQYREKYSLIRELRIGNEISFSFEDEAKAKLFLQCLYNYRYKHKMRGDGKPAIKIKRYKNIIVITRILDDKN